MKSHLSVFWAGKQKRIISSVIVLASLVKHFIEKMRYLQDFCLTNPANRNNGHLESNHTFQGNRGQLSGCRIWVQDLF